MRVSGEKLLQSILDVVAAAALAAAEAGDAIEIKQAPSAAPHKASAPTRLTTHGLSEAIRILAQHCRRPPTVSP
jgi:hypothetical protein